MMRLPTSLHEESYKVREKESHLTSSHKGKPQDQAEKEWSTCEPAMLKMEEESAKVGNKSWKDFLIGKMST